MQTNTNSTESKTDSTIPTPASTIPKPPGVVETPSTHDDFGYKSEESSIPKPAEVIDDKPVEKPATGYGKKPEESSIPKPTETPPVEGKKDEVPATDEEKIKLELAEVVKTLPESFDKELVTKFATENKFTKEQLEAYVKFAAEDVAAKEAQHQELVKTTRAKWEKELKEDPDFGGENFDLNLDRAEKVLEKYLVNTKKELTERGSMLPPYIMRDLYALSKVLNPKAPLVVGEANTVVDERSHLDILYK